MLTDRLLAALSLFLVNPNADDSEYVHLSSWVAAHGSFRARDNRAPAVSMQRRLEGPPKAFVYERLAHPPATFVQEKLKSEVRLPAARKFIAEHALNEHFEGPESSVGLVVQGGLYNGVLRALRMLGLADDFGASRIPILALNVVYPLVPQEIAGFCAGKQAVLVVEEGLPEFIEQEIALLLRRADVPTKLHGKDSADLGLPVAPLNAALERVFAAERHLVGRLPLPPGLSLFAVASAI